MRTIAILAAALAAWTSAAFAQDTRWRHPAGLWSLDIAGWSHEEANGALFLLRLGETAETAAALCVGREEGMPRPAEMTDDEVRSYAGQLNGDVMPVPPVQGALQSVEHPEVDGVTLAAFRVHDVPGQTMLDMRMLYFYLPSPGSVARFQIQCVTPMGASSDADAAIERLAMSIRFAN